MQITDLRLSTVSNDATASTGHDGFDHDGMSTTALPAFSATTGVADGLPAMMLTLE